MLPSLIIQTLINDELNLNLNLNFKGQIFTGCPLWCVMIYANLPGNCYDFRLPIIYTIHIYMSTYTVCPSFFDPFYIMNIVYIMGQDFWDI